MALNKNKPVCDLSKMSFSKNLLAKGVAKSCTAESIDSPVLFDGFKVANATENLLKQGADCLKRGDFSQAKIIFSDIVAFSPNNIRAIECLSYVGAKLNDHSLELSSLLKLASKTTLGPKKLARFFMLCSSTVITDFDEEVVKGLLSILTVDELCESRISGNLSRYVIWQYQLDKLDAEVNIESVFTDQLLHCSLSKVRLNHHKIENFLMLIRESMLSLVLENSMVPTQAIPFLKSLALQNYYNEYVHYISNNEKELLMGLTSLLEQDMQNESWVPSDSEGVLLLISCYQSLHELRCNHRLLACRVDLWPLSLREIAKKSLFDIQQEVEVAQSIRELKPIENPVSKAVQSHYEQNPYPRWSSLYVPAVATLADFISYYNRDVKSSLPKAYFARSPRILLAGCGTGKQAIFNAKRSPYAKITAVDLSRRSLAYSIIKAKQFGMENIEFFHADLLDLPEVFRDFDYIECTGVLHHMNDPMQGWQSLVDLLIPGGVMKIALYSAIARRDITRERKKIYQLKLQPTADTIRLYRQAFFKRQRVSPVLLGFSDFFSLSECRDLLFHQHEQCFTWPKVKEYCEQLKLKFLGIVGDERIRLYHKHFPEEQENGTANIDKLEQLEKISPYEFRSMYQFLVQKPSQ